MATKSTVLSDLLAFNRSHILYDYWFRSTKEQKNIKKSLRTCVETLKPELVKDVQKQLDAIEAHEKVVLHPRDRVVFICEYEDVKIGTHAKITLMGVSTHVQVSIKDPHLRCLSVPPVVLHPASSRPGPRDIYRLSGAEQGDLDALVEVFLHRRYCQVSAMFDAMHLGLLEPLFAYLLVNHPKETERLLKKEEITHYGDTSKVFTDAYIAASVHVITTRPN